MPAASSPSPSARCGPRSRCLRDRRAANCSPPWGCAGPAGCPASLYACGVSPLRRHPHRHAAKFKPAWDLLVPPRLDSGHPSLHPNVTDLDDRRFWNGASGRLVLGVSLPLSRLISTTAAHRGSPVLAATPLSAGLEAIPVIDRFRGPAWPAGARSTTWTATSLRPRRRPGVRERSVSAHPRGFEPGPMAGILGSRPNAWRHGPPGKGPLECWCGGPSAAGEPSLESQFGRRRAAGPLARRVLGHRHRCSLGSVFDVQAAALTCVTAPRYERPRTPVWPRRPAPPGLRPGHLYAHAGDGRLDGEKMSKSLAPGSSSFPSVADG